MLAEVLLVLAGHPSSLFSLEGNVVPSFTPLLHPGEQQSLETLGTSHAADFFFCTA
jgi:gamma-tubulin complex component 4